MEKVVCGRPTRTIAIAQANAGLPDTIPLS